ncbi:hypothetical protein ACV229_30215 [Burkholderia sp. MR1-5-21]
MWLGLLWARDAASKLVWAAGTGRADTRAAPAGRAIPAPSRGRKTRILPCGGRMVRKLGDRTTGGREKTGWPRVAGTARGLAIRSEIRPMPQRLRNLDGVPQRSTAGGKWMSDDVYARVASKNKHVHIVEGANYMSLCDVPQYVDEAAATLAPFSKENL